RLQASWVARRAELEAQLRAQFPAVKNLNSRIQIAALLEARGWRPAKRTEKTRQPVTDDALLETLPETYPEFTGLAEHYILGRRLRQLANGKHTPSHRVHPDRPNHGGGIPLRTPHNRTKHPHPNH